MCRAHFFGDLVQFVVNVFYEEAKKEGFDSLNTLQETTPSVKHPIRFSN